MESNFSYCDIRHAVRWKHLMAYCRFRSSLTSVVVFVMFLLINAPISAAAIISEPDTNEVEPKYDINDPRNPDCPCHQWQQQANAEWEQQQLQNPQVQLNNPQVQVAVNPVNANPVDINANVNAPQIQITGGGGVSNSSIRLRPFRKMYVTTKKFKRRIGRKFNGTRRGRIHVTDCFHWG